jgi:hypothetical protein
VSDSKPPDDDAVGDAAEGEAREVEDDDDKIDLDDLDRLGVDGVVDEMGGPGKQTARRPVWLAALVMIASIVMLSWLWPDFRYWMQPSEPVQIGAASEWMQDGKVPPGWENTHVAIEGTPNVRWAMLLGEPEGERQSFFDLVEAEGQLFVITPQLSDQHETRRFAGHFEGRLVRLGDKAFLHDRMAQLYAQENVTRAVDIAPSALADALRNDVLTFETMNEGTMELAAEDRIRFVVSNDDARVMLGGLSFKSGEEAEAAVAELGYPYFRLPDIAAAADPRKALGAARGGEPPKPGRADAYRFVVRIPEAERAAVRSKLEAKMVGTPDPTDHRQGASVFARSNTYFAPAGSVQIEGDEIIFPHDENDPAPGYTVRDGKLVEQRLTDGRMRVALAQLEELRLEVPIVVDADGYLLVDGFEPDNVAMWAFAFLGVLAIAMLNGLWLVLGVLRRR